MAKTKRDYKELVLGLVVVAVIGAVFLAQTPNESETITGGAVYPVYAAVTAENAKAAIQGTLNEGGYGICESYSWGAQTKTTDGKSLGAKVNVCSEKRFGYNYECSTSVRSYIYRKEVGVVCSPSEVCDIVSGKAACIKG